MDRAEDDIERKVLELARDGRFKVHRRPPLEPSTREDDSIGMSDDLTDAKIAAAEARGETALVRALGDLRGDIRELKASTASKGTVIITGITLFLGLAALLAGFLAYGAQWFGNGVASGDIARAAAEHAVAAYAAAHK